MVSQFEIQRADWLQPFSASAQIINLPFRIIQSPGHLTLISASLAIGAAIILGTFASDGIPPAAQLAVITLLTCLLLASVPRSAGVQRGSVARHGRAVFMVCAAPAGSDGPGSSIPGRGDGPKGARGVLIVDDDRALARVMAAHLERAGHGVRLAHDAEDALSVLAESPRPAVVLTDIMMRGEMQGQDLADLIRQRYPGIRVILMSGYAPTDPRGDPYPAPDQPFLQKPVSARTLQAIVNRAMGLGDGEAPDDTG